MQRFLHICTLSTPLGSSLSPLLHLPSISVHRRLTRIPRPCYNLGNNNNCRAALRRINSEYAADPSLILLLNEFQPCIWHRKSPYPVYSSATVESIDISS